MERPTEVTSGKSQSPPPPHPKTSFRNLPLEIRLRIWEELLTPKVVSLIAPTAPRRHENPIFRLDGPALPFPAHVLLHICHESRSVVLRRQKLITGAYFDARQDVLYLADPEAVLHENRTSSLRVLREELGEREVRYLGLSYYSWRKAGIFGELGELVRVRGLRVLWVCFLGSDGDAYPMGEGGGGAGVSVERGWLAGVRAGRCEKRRYEEMVERAVKGDLRRLEEAGGKEGWKAPELRFVENRRCLDEAVERLADGREGVEVP